MKNFSQRRAFTTLMTLFATSFCIAISNQIWGGQADLLADILKIAVLIAISTAIISFTFWTLTHLKKASVPRGALAGFLTPIFIIPLPTFVWVFKTEFLSKFRGASDGFMSAALTSVPDALEAGLYTFISITKASLIAIVASMIVGAACAHFIPRRSQKLVENSPTPQ